MDSELSAAKNVSPIDRVAVIVNGNARQVTEELVSVLDQIVQSGDLFVSREISEAERIAATVVERGYATVLTGGGDGTFVQMVTRITRLCRERGKEPPRFGLLRLGTGNALAWVLGNDDPGRHGVRADLARLRVEGGSRHLRLIDIEGWLSPFAGLGVDATCLEHYGETKAFLSRHKLTSPLASGAPAYALSIAFKSLPAFVLRPHPRVRVVSTGGEAIAMGPDDKPAHHFAKGQTLYEGPSRIVALSTIPYWGFGARIFPFAEERENCFQLRIADITSTQVVRNLSGFWKGTYRHPNVRDFLVEGVRIHFEEAMPLQIGGDVIGRRTTVEAQLAPPIRVVDYYAPPPV